VRATAEQPISSRAKSTDSDVVSTLRAHVETLKADVVRLEGDLAGAQARADKATAELAIEKEQARAAQVCADQATVELVDERAVRRTDQERAAEREAEQVAQLSQRDRGHRGGAVKVKDDAFTVISPDAFYRRRLRHLPGVSCRRLYCLTRRQSRGDS
jgi:hypothetical protein